MADLIDRQAAIDVFMTSTSDGDKFEWCKWVLEQLPSAQPVNYGSTNLIDKKEVLDAIHKAIFSIIDTKSPLTVIDKQLLSINKAITTKIKELPSAQPEIIRCKECANAPKCFGDVVMKTRSGGYLYCPLTFCSEGKRKDG